MCGQYSQVYKQAVGFKVKKVRRNIDRKKTGNYVCGLIINPNIASI